MKNDVFKYLEYSLFVHNYVIIPGLGGFIVNLDSAYTGISIESPKFKIAFNPELNHDDGVLVSYIVKDEKISYSAASQRIKDFVKDLKRDLQNDIVVSFGLGRIFLDKERNISFAENQSIVYPLFYGLTSVKLQYLTDIRDASVKETKSVLLRNIMGGVAAVAAAVFLFAIPSIDISNKGNVQEVGFIHTLTNSLSLSTKSDSSLLDIKEEVQLENKIFTRTYYVVVGGADSKPQAEHLLEKVQSSGFNEAAIVQSEERYRIYIASFTDKVEGESFLETFRKENPKYESAWLYSKRN
ncbi:HU domain-containing protein [Dysgonomonas reticulitermitis]